MKPRKPVVPKAVKPAAKPAPKPKPAPPAPRFFDQNQKPSATGLFDKDGFQVRFDKDAKKDSFQKPAQRRSKEEIEIAKRNGFAS
jgi:hypothetical protein